MNPQISNDPMSSGLFTADFITSVASSLDEFEKFDTTIFRPDGDINFERDFGQWFQSEDGMSGSLDMK
jgi:collagen type III alpha